MSVALWSANVTTRTSCFGRHTGFDGQQQANRSGGENVVETEMYQIPVSLPESVYKQLGSDKESVAETLSTLATEHAQLQDSIELYTDHGGSSSDREESELGPAKVLVTPPPLNELFGFEPESIESGQAELSFEPGPEHASAMGTLHGGVLCDLGDAAMGFAYGSTLNEDESFTTIELDIKFQRPVWEQELTATATVVNRGRTVGLVECDITDPDGKLVAHLQSVCMTLRGEKASGR